MTFRQQVLKRILCQFLQTKFCLEDENGIVFDYPKSPFSYPLLIRKGTLFVST